MRLEPLVGIVIEGVGTTTAKTGGACWWYQGAYVALPVFPSPYAWTAGLIELPASITDTLDPLTGKLQTSGFTFRFSLAHQARFLWRAGRGIYALDDAIDDTTTTIPLNKPGLDGEVIYVDGETIVLGAFGFGFYTGSSRGYWSSEAQAHEESTIVYDTVPWWVGRRVELFTRRRDEGSAVRRWQGIITKPARTDSAGMVIELETEGVLGVIQRGSVRKSAVDLNARRNIWYEERRGFIGTLTDEDGGRATPTTSSTPASATTHIQVGTALIEVTADVNGELGPVQFGGQTLLLGSTLEIPDQDEGTGRRLLDASAWEVLLFEGVHPLDIVRALTGNDGPTLGKEWRLDIPWIDAAALEALADARPWEQVDQLLLGWDGQDVSLWYVIDSVLMRPFGYMLGLTTDHTLVPLRMDAMPLQEWDAARVNVVSPYRDGPQKRTLHGSQVDQLSARLGALPWRDAKILSIQAPGISSRRAELIGIQARELDLRTLSRSRANEVLGSLLSHVLLQLYDVPTYQIAIQDDELSGADLTLGKRVVLANVGLLGHRLVLDGELVALGDATGEPRLAGQIISRRFDLKRYRYEITLLMSNVDNPAGFIRERAPAAIVISHDDATGIVQLNSLGFSDKDGAWFESGDEIQIQGRDGVAWSVAHPELSARTDTSLTVPALAFGSNIPAGSLVRLAPSQDYENAARFPAVTDRPYTFLADGSSQIARPGPALVPADIFGASLGVGAGGATTRALADTFDGDEYRHLDDTAIAPYQPHGTALIRSLDAALRYIERAGDPVSWSPLSGHAGAYGAGSEDDIRTYATYSKGEIIALPWIIARGCTSITVRLWYRGFIETGAPVSALAMRIELDGIAPKTTDVTALSMVGTWQEVKLDVVLKAAPVDDLETTIRLTIEGGARGDTPHATYAYDVTPGPGQVLEAPSGATGNPYADDGAGSRPRAGTQDLLISSSEEAPDSPYDHIRRTDLSGNRGMWVRTPAQATQVRDLNLWPSPYLQLRGAEIRPHFEPTDVGIERYDARNTVLGSDDILIRQRLTSRARRPRPIWLGPKGVMPKPEANWPDGFHEQWLRSFQDGAGTWQTYATAHGIPRSLKGVFKFLVDLMPIHAILSYSSGGELETLIGAATRAAWRWRVRILSLSPGASSPSALIVGEEQLVTIDHYPLDDAGASTALKQELIRFLKPLGVGGGYTYKEGMRYPEDNHLLRRFTFDVPYELGTDQPYQIELQGRVLPADNTEITWGAGSPGPDQILDTLQAYVAGASVWEVSG